MRSQTLVSYVLAVIINNASGKARNLYIYTATGTKLRVKSLSDPTLKNVPMVGTSQIGNEIDQKTMDYVGNMIYENGKLKMILTDNGYYDCGSVDKKYYFYIKDHLGNNRVVADADGSLVQSTQYYPFGLAYGDGMGSDKQPYKYNGKELDSDHGLNMYDYSARYYEPAVGRFTSVDPLAEKYYSISPYAYVANNPIKYIDPTGMFYDDYYNNNGNYLGTDNKKTDNIRIINQKDFDKITNYGNKLSDKSSSDVKAEKELTNKSESIETANLTADAYANIFTNIVSKTEGVDMGEIRNGKISVAVFSEGNIVDKANNPSLDKAQNASVRSYKGKSIITATIDKSSKGGNLNLYSTVSNVQNALGAHEAIGHGQKGWGDKSRTHHKVYEYQMDHSSWGKTTSQFKTTIQNLYQKYLNPKR